MANYQEPKVEFTKLSFNVPKKLLEEFETIAFLNHYSRVEAFKEAMRIFITNMTPDDYVRQDDMKNYWRQMLDAVYEVTKDPKYQQLTATEKQAITQQQAPGATFEKILQKQQTES